MVPRNSRYDIILPAVVSATSNETGKKSRVALSGKIGERTHDRTNAHMVAYISIDMARLTPVFLAGTRGGIVHRTKLCW